MNTKVIITGFAFIAFTALASAQTKDVSSSFSQQGSGAGVNFVDANKNGICDNFENKQSNTSDRRAEANRSCGRNGIQMKVQGRGNGQGNGRGMRNCQGNVRNFNDVNKNGVCDYLEKSDPPSNR